MLQGSLLQWVLRLEHLSQFVWPLPPELGLGPGIGAQCSAVQCDADAGIFLGSSTGAVWHLPVCVVLVATHETVRHRHRAADMTSASASHCCDSSSGMLLMRKTTGKTLPGCCRHFRCALP